MNLERKQRLERRKRLQQQVQLEKARLATPTDSSAEAATLPMDSLVIYSTHFLIETQAAADDSDNDEDCYAVYRIADLMSVTPNDGGTPEPVHVFDLLLDASNFVAIMDKIVSQSDPNSPGVELSATPTDAPPKTEVT